MCLYYTDDICGHGHGGKKTKGYNNNNSEHTPVRTRYLMNLRGSLLYIQSSYVSKCLSLTVLLSKTHINIPLSSH